jgi:hypothetical protein
MGTRAVDFQREIERKPRPVVVHFCGHGAGAGGLILEDENGGEQLLPSDALAELFRLYKDQVQCVVLNCCLSAAQAELVVRYIPYVIGMNREIGNKAAIHFSRGFYDALFAGNPYDRAFELACTAIHFEHLDEVIQRKVSTVPREGSVVPFLPEHLKPILLVHMDVFIRCHPGDDARAKEELLAPLKLAGLRVTGDWQFREGGLDTPARKVGLRTSDHVLVFWTPAGSRDFGPELAELVQPPGKDRNPVRVLCCKGTVSPAPTPGVAVHDFGQALEPVQGMTRLLADLGLPDEVISKVLAHSAGKGFDALEDLMRADDKVREAVKAVRDTLTDARDAIDELNRWKLLHDNLHRLTLVFQHLSGPAEVLNRTLVATDEHPNAQEQQEVVGRCWKKMQGGVNSFRTFYLGLLGCAKPPAFKQEEVLWIEALKEFHGNLDEGCRDRSIETLNLAIEGLSPGGFLGQQMNAVDQKILTTATQRLPLQALVNDLKKINDAMERKGGAAEASSRLEFARGVVALQQMHGRLQTLVASHTYLQTVDSLTSPLDDPKVTPRRIALVWKIVEATPAPDSADAEGWLGELLSERDQVGRAIPAALAAATTAAGLPSLLEAFRDFRARLGSGFFGADNSLKEFVQNLQAIRGSLSKAIEGT